MITNPIQTYRHHKIKNHIRTSRQLRSNNNPIQHPDNSTQFVKQSMKKCHSRWGNTVLSEKIIKIHWEFQYFLDHRQKSRFREKYVFLRPSKKCKFFDTPSARMQFPKKWLILIGNSSISSKQRKKVIFAGDVQQKLKQSKNEATKKMMIFHQNH